MNERRPTLTRAEVREVDRLAIMELGIPGCVLMENAGLNAARAIDDMAGADGLIAILCGAGNNGGDGYVIARHLALRGRRVALVDTRSGDELSGDAALNHGITERMGIERVELRGGALDQQARALLDQASILVDALLGTGFSGEVRAPLAGLIDAINAAGTRRDVTVVAIDVPSGLDCDSGRPSNATVRAARTLTFVARKVGFEVPGAADWTGAIDVLSIGAPLDLIDAARGAS